MTPAPFLRIQDGDYTIHSSFSCGHCIRCESVTNRLYRYGEVDICGDCQESLGDFAALVILITEATNGLSD